MSTREVDAIEQLVIAGVASTGRALGGHDGIDLTFPQWRVLVVLGDSTVGATVKNVADQIGVTLPATSRQLRRLEGRGLVKIEPDADDRRATRAKLTQEGERVRRRIFELRRDEIARALTDIRLDAAVVESLAQIARSLDEPQ